MFTASSHRKGLVLLLLCLGLGACSTRNWYEGVRMSAQAECNRMEPAARQECLAKINKTSYDDYEKERNRNRP